MGNGLGHRLEKMEFHGPLFPSFRIGVLVMESTDLDNGSC